MPSQPATELLPVIETGGGLQLPLVPALCGVAIAGSWLAACVAIILGH